MSEIINKVDKDILNKKKVDILCKTEKDANELLEQLNKLGYKWALKYFPNDINYFGGIVYNVYYDKNVYYSSPYSHYDYIFKSNSKTNKIKSIKHIIDGTTTIVILEDGRKGVAKLHPSDEFDEYVGFEIAYKRALGTYNDNYNMSEEKFWIDFTNNKVAIILESEKEAKKFQKMCKLKSLYTYGNDNYFLEKCDIRNVCFTCGRFRCDQIEWDYVNYYKNKGLKIVKFKNVFKLNNIYNNNLSQYTNEELLEELKNRLN